MFLRTPQFYITEGTAWRGFLTGTGMPNCGCDNGTYKDMVGTPAVQVEQDLSAAGHSDMNLRHLISIRGHPTLVELCLIIRSLGSLYKER